jgi:hypothetical protein
VDFWVVTITSGAPAYSTIQFVGTLGHIPVTILLDSGNTSTFVSESIVLQLSAQVVLPHQIFVSVAGGGVLTTKGILHNVNWSIDDVSFVSDFKILPLTHYDIVLGMDWLETFSPMQVHWRGFKFIIKDHLLLYRAFILCFLINCCCKSAVL